MSPQVELPACAVIRLPDGTTFAGHRHFHCLGMINQSFAGKCVFQKGTWVQGFMTTRGRFVGRTEAWNMRVREGLPSANPDGYRGHQLYSEDLY